MDAAFWLLFGAVAVYEAVALSAKRTDWTISGKAWQFRDLRPPWTGAALDTLWLWLGWHLVFDDLFFVQGGSWVDLVLVPVFFVVSVAVERQPLRK